jgi:predicted tellurium resistance membrane protein TerC
MRSYDSIAALVARTSNREEPTIIIIGAVLVIVGLIGLAYPVFTTSHNEEVAKLGVLNCKPKKRSAISSHL